MKARLALFFCGVTVAALLVAVLSLFPLCTYAAADSLVIPIHQNNPDALAMIVGTDLDAGRAARSTFDPAISLAGALAPGSLGLPGEQITWTISVTNPGPAAGTDLVITDTLRDELRVDRVIADRGQVVVSSQVVVLTIPVLNPGETALMQIQTTVLRGPANGVLVNQVVLAAPGSAGAITRSAAAEVFVPTGLPATGYPPSDDLPGEGEPSAVQVGLIAFGVVALTAVFVWRRGRRRWS